MPDQTAQLQQCIDCCDDCCDLLKNDPQCADELAKCQSVKEQLESAKGDGSEGVRAFDWATLLPLFIQFAGILQQLLQKKQSLDGGVQSGRDEIQAAAERGAKGVAGPQSLKRGTSK
jgi:hypothetical protein